jgi:hypothetical protein
MHRTRTRWLRGGATSMRTHWMKMMVDRSVLASWWLDKIKSWMGDWILGVFVYYLKDARR